MLLYKKEIHTRMRTRTQMRAVREREREREREKERGGREELKEKRNNCILNILYSNKAAILARGNILITYARWLLLFNGISTFVGYFMPNHLYTYILNVYDLVWLSFMAYQLL